MEAVLEGSRLGVDSCMKELPELGREMDIDGERALRPRGGGKVLRNVEMGVHFNDTQEDGNSKKL